MYSIRLIALCVSIVSAAVGTALILLQVTGNRPVAVLSGVTLATHLVLICVLTRVWLVERYPNVRHTLEKIPGVRFSVPVPEALKPGYSPQPATPSALKEHQASNSQPSSAEVPPRVDTSHPFTLGTLAFEPPEPIQIMPADPPLVETIEVQPVELSPVERACRKSTVHRQRSSLGRLHTICRLLKQANLEVNVWTEGELAILANTMLGPKDRDPQMVALLVPQNVVKVNRHRTFEFEHHATLLNSVLLATGQKLEVAFVNSMKDSDTGQCVVNFEYQRRPITWRFQEKDNLLSDKFLKNTLHWVSQKADGQFRTVQTTDDTCEFVFLPNTVWQQLAHTIEQMA